MNANACPYFSPGSTTKRITVAEIQIDAAKGCVYCKLLQEIAKKLGEQRNLIFDTTHTRKYGWRRVSCKRSENDVATDIEVFVTEGSTKLFPELQHRVLVGEGSLQKSLPYIQAWEHKCSEKHESCPKELRTVLPKRLIDVRTEPVQLIETTKNQIDRYIALSHCWGASQPDCLTRIETLDRNKRGITNDSLPHTFLDAIKVTRLLEIPYLWIDSLCIIQNDKQDWQRESAKMATYYRNSYLTVCATAARNDGDGLWPREDSLSGVELVTVRHAGTQYEIYARASQLQLEMEATWDIEAAHMSWCTNMRAWDTAQRICPLVSRGWTFQERLLAPRLLHFGYQEILWQCPSSADCECCFSALDGSKYMDYARYLTNKAREMQKADTLEKVAKAWRTLVEFYSYLDLSKSTDRLPAISGLANTCMSVRKPDTYHAGLWESTMIDDLCWCVPYGLDTWARPTAWVAPSWSWASISQHVWYEFQMYKDIAVHTQLIKGTTVLAGADLTGEILESSITLFGPLQSANVEYIHWKTFKVKANSLEIRCHIDSSTDFEIGLVQWGSTVFCLRMKTISRRMVDWIMILVAKNGRTNTYQRVGMAHPDTDKISQHWYKEGYKTQIEIV